MEFPIKGRKIRTALVGCGRIAVNHLAALDQHSSDAELVAVCDSNPAKLEQCVSDRRIAGYLSLSHMLHEELIDLAVLCTPSGLHASQAIQVARSGIHVMTEKPMATRWQDGLDMVRACDVAGVRLFVVKQNRLNSTLKLLKRAIDEKRFGKIHFVQVNVFWSRPDSYYEQDGWRGTWEFDGGAFMNQGSHYIDLLHWLFGPVDTVFALTSTRRRIEVEDTGVISLRWRHGMLGAMSLTMLAYPKNLEGSITVLGDTGTVRIGGVALNKVDWWNFKESANYDADVGLAGYETQSVYGFGHPNYYQNTINVLRGRENPTCDGRDGLKSLELLIAAYRSAREKAPIGLPLEL